MVDTLNRFVAQYFAALGIYATFFCVEINLLWGGLTYAGAGHPPALLWRKNGATERLGSCSPLIGIFPEMGRLCQVQKTRVQSGDRLILYTDGLTETRDTADSFFGIEAVAAVLAALPAEADSDQALEAILAARRHFSRGAALSDDVLAVAARFL